MTTWKEAWREAGEKQEAKRKRKGTPTFFRYTTAGACFVSVVVAIPLALSIIGIPFAIALVMYAYWAWNKYVTNVGTEKGVT